MNAPFLQDEIGTDATVVSPPTQDPSPQSTDSRYCTPGLGYDVVLHVYCTYAPTKWGSHTHTHYGKSTELLWCDQLLKVAV